MTQIVSVAVIFLTLGEHSHKDILFLKQLAASSPSLPVCLANKCEQSTKQERLPQNERDGLKCLRHNIEVLCSNLNI